VPLLFALAITWWWRATRRPWAGLGFVRPRVFPIVIGFVLGGLLKILMKAVVMPLLGASPVNQPYHFLEGNAAALPGMIATIVLIAGFGEEVTFRGFLFDRFGAWWGRSGGATIATIVMTAALFGIAHLSDQGWDGVKLAFVNGLIWGAIYARTRDLWPLMAGHVAFDLVAVALIYFGWEVRIAHLLFKP
jgi:membrane protease YdiL (CAAX protease family)